MDLGLDLEFEPLNEEKCSKIDLPLIPEDMVEFHGKVISALDDKIMSEHTTMSAARAKKGQLVEIDIDALAFRSVKINNFPSDIPFNPHGMYLLGDKLYIINHCYSDIGDQVELIQLKFHEGQTSAEYLKSIKFGTEYSGMLNDIAVSDSGHIYVSLFKMGPDLPEGKHPESTLGNLKGFIGSFVLPMTKLLACRVEGQAPICTEEDRAYVFNGVTRRNDLIIAVDFMGKVLYMYKILATGRLEKVNSVSLSYPVDNLEYFPQNDEIYGAGVLRVIDIMEATSSIDKGEKPKFVPGHVFRVNLKDEKPKEETLFRGNMLSFPSSGIRVRDKIVMGSPITAAVAVCKL